MTPMSERGLAPTGPRVTRSGGSSLRGRGGISKRRGGNAPRVDRDGDLVMDPSLNGQASRKSGSGIGATRGNRRGGRASTSSAGSRPAQKALERALKAESPNMSLKSSTRYSKGARGPDIFANSMTLKVLGVKDSKAANNPDGGVRSLTDFLERKASRDGRRILIKKTELVGDVVYVLTTKEDGPEFLKLNDFLFAGAKISVTESETGFPGQHKNQPKNGPELSEDAQETIARMNDFLVRRYNAEAKILDLSNMASDPVISEAFVTRDKAEKTFKILMTLCQKRFTTRDEKREAVQFITLASNNIDHASQVFDLAETFPDIKGLDLQVNNISELKNLNRWRGRFRNLETLLIMNNPIDSDPAYKPQLLEWYPRLQILNGEQVRTLEEVLAKEAASKPTPIPQQGPDFRDVNNIGEQFIRDFFIGYDVDRQALANKYFDEESAMSIAVNTRNLPGMPNPSWAPYLKFSRNQEKITTSAGRIQRLFRGLAVIQDFWKTLPGTKHPDLNNEVTKYIIDCHRLAGLADPTGQNPGGLDGLVITIHGQFDELDGSGVKTTQRSFSRSFTLGPGFTAEKPIRVVNDLLTLRAFNPVPVLGPPAASVPVVPVVPAAPVAPSAPAAPAPSQEDQQRAMVIQLSNQTGMTLEFSEMCLSQVQWNFDQALVIFNERKEQLPANAWRNAA